MGVRETCGAQMCFQVFELTPVIPSVIYQSASGVEDYGPAQRTVTSLYATKFQHQLLLLSTKMHFPYEN